MKRWYTRVVSLLLCLTIAATLVPCVRPTVGAPLSGLSTDKKTYYISSFSDLVGATGYSRTAAGNTIRYVLQNDIDIKANELATLAGLEIDHLTFGDRDHFFLGEFDGQGHTITGLNYNNDLFKVATRTGLFSFVGHKDAAQALKYNTYIHDLTIQGASMHADYCSGILAGEAYNTRFVNVNVVDSSMSVNPADNTLVLITDGGVLGGAIAGYASRCTFYNCESRNTVIRTNSVSGVAALSGKPLYLGGLVGQAETFTEIEYCRVVKGEVKNRYESSVGALGGFTCYAGGLAGELRGGSKLIDSFATCDVSFYAATYVGVGAGCAGHAGGLVGKTEKDDNGGVLIKRCHYADGTISSYQYNTLLLMIPVQIANDVNRSGLVDLCDKSCTQVYDSYFNYLDTIGPKSGKPANVLGDKGTSDHYGPQPEDRYEDRVFWENRGYDFAGNLDRSVEDSTTGPFKAPQPYFNKWVMYYYDDPVLDAEGHPTGESVRRGYPVHGLSVAATFDFPHAATVTLAPSGDIASLSDMPATTEDPYRFAVLGIYPTERTVTEYTDGTPTKGGLHLKIECKPGYRFVNWYLVEDVAAAGLPAGRHDYFDHIFADPAALCPLPGADGALNPTKPRLGEDNPHVAADDNQLYVARCEARVVFCGLDGTPLTATEDNPADAWYLYAAPLPTVTPDVGPSNPNAQLIGWTTRADDLYTPATQGWETITTSELAELKGAGVFYEPGDPVLSTMTLYPVYADLSLNVITEIEGFDSETDKTRRAVLGQTYVDGADGAITLRIKSFATDSEAAQPTTAFPEGYEFLGWYEDGHCVSRKRDYTLPDTVDLNQKHTYQARFQYRVRYYVNYINNTEHDAGTYAHSTLYATRWELYEAPFTVLKAPDFHKNDFVLWWTEGPQVEDGTPETPAHGYQGPITDPVTVYSYYKATEHSITDTITVTSDFPHAAEMTITDRDPLVFTTKPDTHYNYIFSNLEKSYGSGIGYELEITPNTLRDGVYSWETNTSLETKVYTYTSHLDADVIFHWVALQTGTEQDPYRVNRRYMEPVLLTAPLHSEYHGTWRPSETIGVYQDMDGVDQRGHKSETSPADPVYDGYYFVGWVDVDDPDTKNALSWIYDVSSYKKSDAVLPDGSGRCLTSDPKRAEPYVLDETDLVTRAMPNVYPVYAQYNIESTTNVDLALDGVVQKPDNPKWTPLAPTGASADLTLTVFNNVPVEAAKPDGEKYTVEYVTVTIDGGAPITIYDKEGYQAAGGDPTADTWTFHYTVEPGKHYLFTAVYKPYVVVFHQNGSAEVQVEVRDYGRPVGVSYLPTVQDDIPELSHVLFVGWTEQTPGNRLYHFFPADPAGTPGGKSSYQKAQDFGFWTRAQTEDTLVTHSMELWPVYATYTVRVDSNIDRELIDSGRYTAETITQVRDLKRTSANTVATVVEAQEVEGYKFDGWYTGVGTDENGDHTLFDGATKISEAVSYTLESSEPFQDMLYTARYRKVYKVIYHERGRDGGGVLYTSYLYEGQDEGKALNQKITTTVDAPKKDAEGNIIRDADGNVTMVPTEVTYHEPLDPVPYHMIYATMAHNESFGQWECHNPNERNPDDPDAIEGELVNVYPMSFEPLLPYVDEHGVQQPGLMGRVGNDDRTINLYPTVWTVEVKDEAGQLITDQVDIDIDMSQMTDDYQNVKANVCFNQAKPYTGSKLTVQVKRTRWVETLDPNKPNIANRGRNDVFVTPYMDPGKTDQLADGKMTANLKGTADEQDDGFAEFTFGDGRLRITKNAPADAKGETFLFQVTSTTDATKTWRTSVTCGVNVTEQTPGGETKITGCTGSTWLRLPPGVYRVEELGNWDWRYRPSYVVYGSDGTVQDTTNANVRVPAFAAAESAVRTESVQVVCSNAKDRDKNWLVRTDREKNLFDKPAP